MNLPLSERLLISLHNICAANSAMTRKNKELDHTLETSFDEVNKSLHQHISNGYFLNFHDNERNVRFCQISTRIARLCALFS